MQLNEGLERLGAKEVINRIEYEGEVFYGTAIENIRIPSTVKRLEVKTFYHCNDLRTVEIPNGVEYIGRRCFQKSGVEEIVFPASMKEVGSMAFYLCERLKRVQLNEGLQILGVKEIIRGRECVGGVFYGSGVESINIPSTLKRIETATFDDCKQFRSIEIPDDVEYIGKSCFGYTAIDRIKLPPRLTALESHTFIRCNNLKKVEIPNGVECIGKQCF